MRKQLTNTTKYEPNNLVKVKVTNKPILDEATGEQFGYDVKVSLTFKAGAKDKQLVFNDADEIADFFGNIDYDEQQQRLLNEAY